MIKFATKQTNTNNMKQLSSNIRQMALWVAGIFFLSASLASAQSAIPLVYDVENTGASFAEPAYPPQDQLPFIQQLPDPQSYRFQGLEPSQE